MAKSGPAYLRYPSDFITGTLTLTLEQKGAYSMLLDMMYDRGEPLPDVPLDLARLCGCSWQKFVRIRDELLRMGKIYRTDDGRLSNKRFAKKIGLIAETETPAQTPPITGGSGPDSGGDSESGSESGSQQPIGAKINGLPGDSRTDSARASSSSNSIAKQPGFALGVDKALAGIIQRLPAAISREKRTGFRQQIWDFGLKDGIDPVLDLLPCVISDADRKRIPTDLRTIGWWRKDALNRKREREARPPQEPIPELSDDDWTNGLRRFLDTGAWAAPGPEPTADGCLAPSDLFAKAQRIWEANGNHPVHEHDSLGNKVPWKGVGPMLYEPTPFGKQTPQR